MCCRLQATDLELGRAQAVLQLRESLLVPCPTSSTSLKMRASPQTAAAPLATTGPPTVTAAPVASPPMTVLICVTMRVLMILVSCTSVPGAFCLIRVCEGFHLASYVQVQHSYHLTHHEPWFNWPVCRCFSSLACQLQFHASALGRTQTVKRWVNRQGRAGQGRLRQGIGLLRPAQCDRSSTPVTPSFFRTVRQYSTARKPR